MKRSQPHTRGDFGYQDSQDPRGRSYALSSLPRRYFDVGVGFDRCNGDVGLISVGGDLDIGYISLARDEDVCGISLVTLENPGTCHCKDCSARSSNCCRNRCHGVSTR